MRNVRHYSNVAEMIKEKGNGIWHFWVFRKNYQSNDSNFVPTNQFEDPNGLFGIIKEVIEIAGDCLIGFQLVFEDEDFQINNERPTIYFRLGEIRLAYDSPEW